MLQREKIGTTSEVRAESEVGFLSFRTDYFIKTNKRIRGPGHQKEN